MSAKAIREATGKNLINKHLGGGTAAVQCQFASVDPDTKFAELVANNPWLKSERLVVKPDQLIKRRGKLGKMYGQPSSSGYKKKATFRLSHF